MMDPILRQEKGVPYDTGRAIGFNARLLPASLASRAASVNRSCASPSQLVPE